MRAHLVRDDNPNMTLCGRIIDTERFDVTSHYAFADCKVCRKASDAGAECMGGEVEEMYYPEW